MADGSRLPDDPVSDDEARRLLLRQDALQAAVAAVLADLDLINLLSRHGQVTPVGSAAIGLLVQPDIDIFVLAADWSPDAVFLAARPLASHPRVQKLNFWNEAGAFTPAGLHEGYYWGVHYVAPEGQSWKLDVWFWRPDAPAPNVEYAEMMRRRLTPETRLAILRIKDYALTPGVFFPFLEEVYRDACDTYGLDGVTVTSPTSLTNISVMLRQLLPYAQDNQRRAIEAIDAFLAVIES